MIATTILGAALGAVAGKVLGMWAAEEQRRLLIEALEGRVAELTASRTVSHAAGVPARQPPAL